MYFANINLVWASNAGVEPSINTTKGTIIHSRINTIFLVHFTSGGLGGRMAMLINTQIRLVPKVKLSSSPVILGKLYPIGIWLKNAPPSNIGRGAISVIITAQTAQVMWLSRR